jgi:hypothetical protein
MDASEPERRPGPRSPAGSPRSQSAMGSEKPRSKPPQSKMKEPTQGSLAHNSPNDSMRPSGERRSTMPLNASCDGHARAHSAAPKAMGHRARTRTRTVRLRPLASVTDATVVVGESPPSDDASRGNCSRGRNAPTDTCDESGRAFRQPPTAMRVSAQDKASVGGSDVRFDDLAPSGIL